MTGAGGIIAANHLFNRAKPDGLTIGAWAAPLVLQQIMGNDAVQFDARKFGYLGVPSPYDTVCTFNDKSGIANMNDWFAAKRPMKISSIGPGTSTSDIPKLLKAALNLPLEVLDGYKGGADARLAVESGEVDGYCGSWQTVETVWRSAYESGKIAPFFRPRIDPYSKYSAFGDQLRQNRSGAPACHGGRQCPWSAVSLYGSAGHDQRPAGAFTEGLCRTLKDPELLAEAKRSQLDVEPVDGPGHHHPQETPRRASTISSRRRRARAEGYSPAEEEMSAIVVRVRARLRKVHPHRLEVSVRSIPLFRSRLASASAFNP